MACDPRKFSEAFHHAVTDIRNNIRSGPLSSDYVRAVYDATLSPLDKPRLADGTPVTVGIPEPVISHLEQHGLPNITGATIFISCKDAVPPQFSFSIAPYTAAPAFAYFGGLSFIKMGCNPQSLKHCLPSLMTDIGSGDQMFVELPDGECTSEFFFVLFW